ncbi:RlpA-like double-psi beta-barrel-containing domain containing protein [Tylopilus felleus]
MMYQLSIVFIVLNIFLLAVRAAPLPVDQSLAKRQNSGRGTWFYDEANESACNTWNQDSDTIVAISADIFGDGGSCGQQVWITANEVTTTATVGDECEGCGPNDLDMSIGLFSEFANVNVGVLSIQWGWD